MDFTGESNEKLSLLGDDTRAFIGRKKSVHEQYGEEGALLLGRSVEKANYGKKVYFDALSPHVVFITGSRGSGKSYALGVIAEELVLKNPNVACVIIDPVGIFWSMKYPNRDKKEVDALGDWGLEPAGIESTRVFIPFGLSKRVPKETYDRLFSIRPSELNVDDWCLTFGIDRFSQSGLLLERAIEKAREKHKNYSIEELIKVIETDKELTSKDKGYKTESRRALVSRLEAARSWGIFSKEGTSLAEICKKGVVSVIDISFLEENVASLVIGMLSRKILNARKMITRQESMQGYVEEISDVDEVLNADVPPTWLFIDEAHTLIPSGTAKTAATDGLIEYVKQGRRPGCSLVFATQQPSAIDTKVLSQLDLLLCHKLVFDEDLKAVMKRIPTSVPPEYDNTKFVKTLPIGIALVGDRSDDTSRAFCIQIRPRFSQHEGREIKVGESTDKIEPSKVEELAVSLLFKKLEETGKMSLVKAEETIDAIKSRYGVDFSNDKVVKKLLKENDCELKDDFLYIPGFEERQAIELELGGVKALTAVITKIEAEKLAEKNKKKKTLGLFGKEEELTDVRLIYEPVWRVRFNLKLDKGYSPKSILVSPDYEVYYYENGLKKTKDVRKLVELNAKEMVALNALQKIKGDAKKIAEEANITPQAAAKALNELANKGLALKKEKEFELARRLDVPFNLNDKKYYIESRVSEGPLQKGVEIEKSDSDERVAQAIPVMFADCEVTSVERVLMPVWKATYVSGDDVRVQKFDAL
ncbi:MAG: helicase HerA-like domain-containing protein [archaeon]